MNEIERLAEKLIDALKDDGGVVLTYDYNAWQALATGRISCKTHRTLDTIRLLRAALDAREPNEGGS